MNKIRLRIIEENNEFWLKAFVDSKLVLHQAAVVFNELVKSKNDTGNYLIFTCKCGVADCGGWNEIFVEHELNKIKWNFDYGGITYSFEFYSFDYKGEIDRVSTELKDRKIILSPKYLVFPE